NPKHPPDTPMGVSDCRKTLILIFVPIKSADSDYAGSQEGDAFSCKASPLEKQPTGLFYQFTPRKCAFDRGFSLTAVSDQRLCRVPKACRADSASIFEKIAGPKNF
ncbi:MAG: hypothetical protein IJX24_07230, partial [Oscillospiraceae bacterium]|nr:hypothetical protein [Oscillospiraceae bacterium]